MCATVREKKHSLFNIDGDKKIEHGFKNYVCIVVVLTSHHFCTASSVCSSSFSDSKSRLNYVHNSVGKIKKIRSQDFLKTLRLFPFISNARYFRKVVIVALNAASSSITTRITLSFAVLRLSWIITLTVIILTYYQKLCQIMLSNTAMKFKCRTTIVYISQLVMSGISCSLNLPDDCRLNRTVIAQVCQSIVSGSISNIPCEAKMNSER